MNGLIVAPQSCNHTGVEVKGILVGRIVKLFNIIIFKHRHHIRGLRRILPDLTIVCRIANGKKVLSTGISNKDIGTLDKLFAKCCELQDDFKDQLLGLSNSTDIGKKVEPVLAEINKTKESLPENCHFYLDACTRMLAVLKEGTFDQEQNARRQELIGMEDAWMHKLRNDFHFIEIPADGNCLFASVGRGARIRDKLLKSIQKDGKMEVSNVTPALVSDHVRQEQKTTKEESSATAMEWRIQAIQILRGTKEFHPLISKEIKEACQIHHAAKPGADVGDPTTRAIWNEMKKRFSDPLATININSEAALDIYSNVMSQEGIYGTVLELEALAYLTKCPVHVYYRVGSSSNDKITSPTRIVGEEFIQSSDGPNIPISVAFYMANKHYNLIVPKAPMFSPINDNKKQNDRKNKQTDEKKIETEGEEKNQNNNNRRDGEEKDLSKNEDLRSSSNNNISNGSNNNGDSNPSSSPPSVHNFIPRDMLKLTLSIEGSISKQLQIHLPRTCYVTQLYAGIKQQWKSISPGNPSDFQLCLKRDNGVGVTELETEFGTKSTSQGLPLPKEQKELTLKEGDTLVLVLKEDWVKVEKTDLA